MRTLFAVVLAAGALIGAGADLDRLLARWKTVPMPFHAEGLSERERQLVGKLVEASRALEDIFWRQSDPEGLALLVATPRDSQLRRLLTINGSRFDLIDGNRPLAGAQAYAPGAGLYPRGVTQAEIERYVAAHPAARAAIYSPYTVIRRSGDGLEAQPYRVEYKQFLEAAAGRPARGGRTQRRSAVRAIPPLAGRCASFRRLLRQRRGLARSGQPEVRRHLRALRNLSRRGSGREDLLRRRGVDSGRRRKPARSGVCQVRSRDPGPAAARARRPPVESRPRVADGGRRFALPRGRSAPRLPGGGRQPA